MARNVPREYVLLDWNWLHETGQLHEDQPLQERIRIAAPRIGMGADALQKALERAGIRNPVPEGYLSEKSRDKDACAVCHRARMRLATSRWEVARAERRIARVPESPSAHRAMAQAKYELEKSQSQVDWHMEAEHAGTAESIAA